MRGELIRRLQYAQWQGPQATVNGDDLFVLSDQVPQDEAWKIVSLSMHGNVNGNVACWAFAVPPQIFSTIPLSDFFSKIGTLRFYPPFRAAVQLSIGGTPANAEVQEVGGSDNSIQFLSPFRRGFFLPPKWGLLGSMSSPVASTGFLVLCASLIRVKLDECLC